MEDSDFTNTLKEYLNKFKDKAVDITNQKSSIKYHDCGHDDGKKCVKVVEVL